jgi:hypothetical protein
MYSKLRLEILDKKCVKKVKCVVVYNLMIQKLDLSLL